MVSTSEKVFWGAKGKKIPELICTQIVRRLLPLSMDRDHPSDRLDICLQEWGETLPRGVAASLRSVAKTSQRTGKVDACAKNHQRGPGAGRPDPGLGVASWIREERENRAFP